MKHASLYSLRRLTKLFYAMGVMMLVFGMLLSAVSMPVYAQGQDDPVETEVVETEPVVTETVVTETVTPDDGDGAGEGNGDAGPGEGEFIVQGQYQENNGNNGDEGNGDNPGNGGNPGNPTGASLAWESGCSVDGCETVSATICNVGDGDMAVETSWDLHHWPAGSGESSIVARGTIPALAAGACATFNYSPDGGLAPGKYKFKGHREPTHPGGDSGLWSDDCIVGQCVTQTPEPPDPQPLDVSWSCVTDEGMGRWTVTNPNEYDQMFTYSIDGGSTSTEKIAPSASGGVSGVWSDVFDLPVGDTHSMTVYWTDSNGDDKQTTGHADTEELASCRLQELEPLGVAWSCVTDEGMGRWTVTNPNEYDQMFTYSIDGGGTSELMKAPKASGGVSGVWSDVFDLPEGDTHSMTVYWTDSNGDDKQTTGHADTDELASCRLQELEPLKVDWDCDEEEGYVVWTIENLNSEPVPFSYSWNGGSLVSASAPAGVSTFHPNEISTSPQTMYVEWDYMGSSGNDSITVSGDAMLRCSGNPPPVRPDLSLEYICGYEEEFETVNYKWRVTNHDDEAINFDWEVVGGDGSGAVLTSTAVESGSGTVPAGGSVIFETSYGKKTVQIIVGDTYVTEETSGDPCLKFLEPVWSCNLQEGEGVDWSVKNPNNFGLTFGYALNTAPVTNDEIAGLADKFLQYSVVDPQTLYVSWETEIWGPRNVHGDADVESCREIPTPTPTDPTPTDPTPTDPTPTDPPRQTTPIVPGTTPTVLVPVTASTPVPTLSAPEIVADPELIPVTGVDFSNAPFGIPALAILKGLLINLGLGLLGLGLVSQGLVGYLSKR